MVGLMLVLTVNRALDNSKMFTKNNFVNCNLFPKFMKVSSHKNVLLYGTYVHMFSPMYPDEIPKE